MLKVVFFDWGHTFTGSGFIDVKGKINSLLETYGLSWEVFYPYWRNLYELRSSGRIKNDSEFHNWLGKILSRRDLPLEEILDIMIDSHNIPRENIEIVKKLKKDYKVGLITNNVQEWIERVLKNYKIENLFDAIIVSSEVGARKPDAKIFYTALKAFSVKPEQTVFISDEVAEDLVAAKGCGMKTIWLDTGVDNEWKKQEREIAKLFKPDAVIKNLKQAIPIIKTM